MLCFVMVMPCRDDITNSIALVLNPTLSNDFVECSGARSKNVRFQSHVLQHGDEEIAERSVVVALEGQVLAVLEAAAREEDGQIRVVVRI